jgi:coenzyme Q-binding protein COQ10
MLRLPCAASRTPVLRLCARGRRPFLSFVAPSQSLVKSHRERKVVPFSCEQMYAVVADVDRYREFLPFCVDSRVLRQPNDNVMEAALRIGFRVFTESYTSRVLMVRCVPSCSPSACIG